MKNLLTYYISIFREWFADIHAVKRFKAHHPKIANFISDRFNPKLFSGLPLTLVVLAIYINIILLSELTESVIDAEWVVIADQEFTNLLFSFRSEMLSQLLFILTQLSDRETVFIVGAIVTGVFIYRKRWVALFVFWLVLAGVGISVRYGKTFISRARPSDVAYYEVEHYSFPSGHATTAIALYGLIAYFFYRHYSKSKYRNLVVWISVIFIILVGFSRVYLGVHYLSDVMAGFLLGALWMLLGISIVEVLQDRSKRRKLKDLVR
jgi:membrane-associated phospholipid phosphatase